MGLDHHADSETLVIQLEIDLLKNLDVRSRL